jgi:Flp pilus assembly protein TadG
MALARSALAGPSGVFAGRWTAGDQRGATSLVFAVSLISLLGMVGLGTEVGTWYLGKRHGQNAADAAAVAGALTIASRTGCTAPCAPAIADARQVATQNSFTNGGRIDGGAIGVAVNNPPTSGPNTGKNTAVEVIITQSRPPLFSGLFVSSMTIANRAVASITVNGNACTLAITSPGFSSSGDVSFQGNTTVNMPGCSIGANGTDSHAISVQGSAGVTAAALISSGGCSGCSGAVLVNQPPTPDPYASIQNVALPSFSGSSCLSLPTVSGTVALTPWDTNGHKAYCGSGSGSNSTLTVSNGNTLNFVPGTYFFYNSSLSFTGGIIRCPTCTAGGSGVTIILTGSPASKIGTININGGATVTLNAPFTNSFNSAFNGILFYTDYHASPTNSCGSAPVNINGGATSILTGGMYFPSVNACFSGNMTAGGAVASNCLVLVGAQVTFTGDSRIDESACTADGTSVPHPLVIALAE